MFSVLKPFALLILFNNYKHTFREPLDQTFSGVQVVAACQKLQTVSLHSCTAVYLNSILMSSRLRLTNIEQEICYTIGRYITLHICLSS